MNLQQERASRRSVCEVIKRRFDLRRAKQREADSAALADTGSVRDCRGGLRALAGVRRTAVSPVMSTLSGYMSEARGRALPEPVLEAVKHHVLDTLAAMVSGAELPPGRAAIHFARAYGGEKVATVVCSNVLCGPIEAALANGVLAHSDETDDSHAASQSHPGCAVVPAALAAGERFGIGGTQFLRAVALGYDVGTRVIDDAGRAEVHERDAPGARTASRKALARRRRPAARRV